MPGEIVYRAQSRLVLMKLKDPTTRLEVLYNPTALDLAGSVDIGSLKSIGGSHPTLMYGSTESTTFPLNLHLSEFGYWVFGKGNNKEQQSIESATAWLTSFAFPTSRGEPAPPLLVIWPHTITMAVVVKDWKVQVTRWDLDLRMREADVSLQLIEYRRELNTQDRQKLYGFGHSGQSMEGHSSAGEGMGYRSPSTGPTLNVGSGYAGLRGGSR